MKYSVVRSQIVNIKEFQRILEKLISKGVIKLILPYKIHFRWFKASCDLYKYGKKDTKIQLKQGFEIFKIFNNCHEIVFPEIRENR